MNDADEEATAEEMWRGFDGAKDGDNGMSPELRHACRQQKMRKARFEEARARISAAEATLKDRRMHKRTTAPEPRYDEVYLDGVRWLDELAGEP